MRSKYFWAALAFIVAISAAAWCAEPGSAAKIKHKPAADERPTLAAIERDRDRLRPLHTKLPPPRKGDWLDKQQEPGQTFDEYRRIHAARQERAERKLYVQPIGKFSEAAEPLVAATTDLLGRWYDAPVERLPAIADSEIPASARRDNPYTGQPQILTSYILKKLLLPRRPRDASAVLGLTATDLWPGEGWNFVFGEASLDERVGVWSLARYGDPAGGGEAFRTALSRTLKVAVHETGHMFGFKHCTAYACGMNGSNNREEMDRTPLGFCPGCEAKIWWALGVVPIRRFESLVSFAKEHKLADEQAAWERSIDALRPDRSRKTGGD